MGTPTPAPLLDEQTVVALGQMALGAERGAVVYADRAPRAPGLVQVGSERAQAAHETLLVFRDEMPGANWMHPCTYALVDIVTRDVVSVVKGDRPPVFGNLPATWAVVSDPDGLADLVKPERSGS